MRAGKGVLLDILLSLAVCCLINTPNIRIVEAEETADKKQLDIIDEPSLRVTPLLEELQRNAVYETPQEGNNLDVVNQTATTPIQKGTPPAFCHMISMSNYNFRGPFLTFSLEAIAAMELAVEHLNSGNGTIISQVEGLNERCPIRFTLEHVDTKGTENVAVDQLMPILQRQKSPEPDQIPPCAFIGPFFSGEAVATALYTSLKGYTQFAPIVTAVELDDKDTFPLFGRFVPPSASFASPLLEFLVGTLGINHLAVLHTDQGTDLTYVSGLRETIKNEYPNLQMQSFSFNIAGEAQQDDYTAVVSAIKKTGYRYIFNLAEVNSFLGVMTEAHKQGIVGEGYTWISGSLGSIDRYFFNKEFLPDSELIPLPEGMLSFDVTREASTIDAFKNSWMDLANHADDLAFLQTKVPASVVPYGRGRPLFSNETFVKFFDAVSSYYDATISLGLAACHNQSADTSPYLSGPQHFEYMVNRDNTTIVEGSTGPLILDPKTGSRDPRSIFYKITNVRQEAQPNGNITFSGVQTHLFDASNGWAEITPIYFSGNTTITPNDLPPEEIDENHVGTGLRAAGLTMSGIVVVASLGLALWTLEHKSSRIVLASQPIFLFIILFGTFLMGASIIPKSLDDAILSDEGASAACTAFPWLLALGWCFCFSALFSKTWRINQIFHNPNFKRVKIEAKDVMPPMFSMLGANVLILSLWTGLDPLVWEQYIVGYDAFGRPNETRGHCESEHFLRYLIPLGVVNLGCLMVAMYQAWKARKISLEFAESEWIARVMNTILLVAFVGSPVLVIAYEVPGSFYFTLCSLIFVVCMSLLIFIFGPKVMETRKQSNKAQARNKAAVQQTLKRMKRSSEGRTSSGGEVDSDADIDSNFNTGSDPEINLASTSGFLANNGSISGFLSNSSAFLTKRNKDPQPRASFLAEGVKVLDSPALQAAKEAEMLVLKKEKHELRRKLKVMEKQASQSTFAFDSSSNTRHAGGMRDSSKHTAEMEGLLEEAKKLAAEIDHLKEEKQEMMDDRSKSEENMLEIIERRHREMETRQKAEEEPERKNGIGAEMQQELLQVKDDNEQLRKQLNQKTKELEEEKRLVQTLNAKLLQGMPEQYPADPSEYSLTDHSLGGANC